MSRLLVLRPEPGASATVKQAKTLGLDAVAVPLFEIEAVAWKAPDAASFDGLLLTSANAPRFAGEDLLKLRGLKVYAVGEATAAAAREAGFDIAAAGDSGVDRLLGSIETDLKLIHLCGVDRKEPAEARQAITSLAVYRAKPVANPDLKCGAGTIALIHSARAGECLAELIEHRGEIAIAAISEASAEAAGSGWKTVEVAEEPDDDALLALAAHLCDKPDPK